MSNTQSARGPPTGGSSSPRRSRPSSRLAGPSTIVIMSGRAVGHDGGGARPATATGFGGGSSRAARRSSGGPKPWGSEGAQPPGQPPQGTHGVWPQGVSWLDALSPRQASPGGASETPLRASPRTAWTGPSRASSSVSRSPTSRPTMATAAHSAERCGSTLPRTPRRPEIVDPRPSCGP